MRFVLPALVLASLALAPARGAAQTTVMGGNVINQTWTAAGSPYTVMGDVTVPAGAYLVIESGVTVRFATTDATGSGTDPSECELRVVGRLTVNGTSAEPVLFDSAGATGQWDGIILAAGSTASTLENAIVTEAETALRVEDTPALLDGLRLTGNSLTGLLVTGSAGATITGSIVTSNVYGVRVETAGAVTVDHCTLHGNGDGVYQTSGSTTVHSSIITQSSDDGVDVNGGTLTISHSNVWSNSVAFEGVVTQGPGMVAANPIYVGAPSSLRLTSNSPSRFSAMDGTDQGALPYASDATPGMYGTLWTDTTIGAGTTSIPGDLTVAPGVTLTLAPGARLSFATTDIMGAYDDAAEAELRVIGTLSVAGTSTMPVILESAGAAGQWNGVTLLPGSGGSSLRGMTITEAETALRVEDTPALLDALTLTGNSLTGLLVTGSAGATLTSSLVTSNVYGVRSETSGAVSVVNCTLHANGDGVYQTSGSTTVRNSIITQSSDDGIDVNGGTATISYSNLWSNSVSYEGVVSVGAGMLSTNPFYVMAPGDLRLSAGSQCIDSGTSTGAPPSDRDGTTRPIDGDGIGGAAWDMGAYEYASVTVCGDGVVGAGEACDDGSLNGMYGRCNSSCTGLGPRCGDAVVNGPEECDDGNGVETDACLGTCRDATCGDGTVHAGVEACDDGNATNTDGCPMCALATCGDGYVQVGVEQCDDMNAVSTDACVSCRDAYCGDGFLRAGMEACDDGNSSNADACTNVCALARCGDGFVGPGESCDDGNTIDDDGCSNTCRTASCGDGIVQSGEECDDGNTVNDDACTNSCRSPRCGDGIIHAGEECDDGNMVNDDTCSNACGAARCGDRIVHAGEECDDGNTEPGDGCTTMCRAARCGDGFVQAGVEDCDDGNARNDDGCVMGCVVAACGDGYLRDGVEACDDGGTIDGDGCTSMCALESCGDGEVQAGEECDDGNASNFDGCLNTCLSARCGDGFVRAGAEACDDGNDLDTDVCLPTCRNASCGDGFVQAGVEACDDGNGEQTDACLLSCEEARCGDGFVRDGVEECDDGNGASGDGCSASCATETVATPDGGAGEDAGTSERRDASTILDAGVNVDGGGSPPVDGGCGCRAAGAPRGASWLLALLSVAGLALRRRRRG